MKMGRVVITLALVLFLMGSAVTLSAAENLLERGVAEYKAENYEEALDLLQQARVEQPDSATAAFYLGLAYKQTGDYREAVRQFSDAVRLVPPIDDAYTELIEALYSLDDLKGARSALAEAEQKGIRPARVAFMKGLLLQKEGDNKGAIASFEKAKALDKSYAQLSDFQIAVAQTRERRYGEAKETLRALVTMDPSSEVASFAREYERAIDQVVGAYKVWRFTAGVAYQYNSNVVLQPSSLVPGVDVTGKGDSSVVGTFGVNYAPLLKGPWVLNAQYNLYTNTYRTINSNNQIVQTLTVVPGYNFQRAALTMPVTYEYALLHERGYLSAVSATPTVSLTLLPGHTAQLSGGYQKRDFLQAPPNNDEDRDSNFYSIAGWYYYSFSGGKGVLNARYELSSENTDGVNWDNTGNRVTLGLVLPLTDALRLGALGDFYAQNYRNVHTVFGVKRRDKTYTGSLSLAWQMRRDLQLNLQYARVRDDSNIPLYDYIQNLYTLGLEYNF